MVLLIMEYVTQLETIYQFCCILAVKYCNPKRCLTVLRVVVQMHITVTLTFYVNDVKHSITSLRILLKYLINLVFVAIIKIILYVFPNVYLCLPILYYWRIVVAKTCNIIDTWLFERKYIAFHCSNISKSHTDSLKVYMDI